MLEIAAAREAFGNDDISDIGLTSAVQNIADGLTKYISQAALCNTLFGSFNATSVQWVIKPTVTGNTLIGYFIQLSLPPLQGFLAPDLPMAKMCTGVF